MANTKKPANPAVDNVDNSIVNTSAAKADVDTEADRLKKELDELKAQMALMVQMMGQAPKAAKSDKQIRFVNLTRGTLVLRGTVMWKIAGQFEYKDFNETEASVIVTNMSGAVREGLVYIADNDFVEEHGLGEVYKHIITEQQLKTLFNQDGMSIIDMYKMANDSQRQIIVDMIVTKKLNGEFVDANAVVEIGKLCGRDLAGIEPDNAD